MLEIEYKSENPCVKSVADDFFKVFGIEVVEPTRNGVWFESRRYGNGKLRRKPKLVFVTRTYLASLLAEVVALDEAAKSEGVE